RLEAIDAVKVRRCTADAWPAAMLDCVAHAAAIPDLRACRTQLALDPAHALAEQEAQLDGDWEQYLVEAEGLRDKMCGCADRACATAIRNDAKAHGLFQPASTVAPPEDVAGKVHAVGDAFGACQKKLGGGPVDDVFAKMSDFKDQMCTCKDSACAQKVSDEMMRWGQDWSKDDDEMRNWKPTSEEASRMADITKAMTDCMTKAMTGP
ncbi:MAG TPA: hypothetical protein VGF94_18935, partial [Kofleriaceae bacterium]